MAFGDLKDCEVNQGHRENAMHALKMLQESSGRSLEAVHAGRHEAVWVGVKALLTGKRLWLTALGRSVGGAVEEKHSIKRIDRLLGNSHLNQERGDWYGWLAGVVLGGCRRPVILVDWSDLDDQKCLYVLRAAVVVGGRALPIYEETHARVGDRRLYRRFLARLAKRLGAECQPILVTDAGFRTWWYELVEARGWHYVGRLRNRDLLRCPDEETWWPNKELHAQATSRAKSLGALWLSKGCPLLTQFYLVEKRSKGRSKLRRDGKRCGSGQSEKHASREREPWLLVSNLPTRHTTAKRVVRLYATRMQIEQSFRDLKAPRHGFAFRENLGRRVERVANLLLLAALGVLVSWLVGLHGYASSLHRGLQANTEKRRKVLSVFFVGLRLIARRHPITRSEIHHALGILHQDVAAQVPS